MEEENTNLKDQVKRLNDGIEKLLESKKAKKVRLPKRLSRNQAKSNWVYIIYINENLELNPMKHKIEEGTTIVEGIPRLATADFKLTYKGKPAMILPAWSVKPFSPVENYEGTVKEQMASAGYKLLLNRIEQGGMKTKKRISGTVIFFLVIGLIVVGYLLLT
jgi:hypothetical protein